MRKQADTTQRKNGAKRVLQGLMLALVLVLGAPANLLAAPDARAASTTSQAKVDINRAGTEELESLPRIGPALARRIIDYRKQHGPFKKTEDLLAVKGIGPKLLAKIRDRLVVGSTGKK